MNANSTGNSEKCEQNNELTYGVSSQKMPSEQGAELWSISSVNANRTGSRAMEFQIRKCQQNKEPAYGVSLRLSLTEQRAGQWSISSVESNRTESWPMTKLFCKFFRNFNLALGVFTPKNVNRTGSGQNKKPLCKLLRNWELVYICSVVSTPLVNVNLESGLWSAYSSLSRNLANEGF